MTSLVENRKERAVATESDGSFPRSVKIQPPTSKLGGNRRAQKRETQKQRLRSRILSPRRMSRSKKGATKKGRLTFQARGKGRTPKRSKEAYEPTSEIANVPKAIKAVDLGNVGRRR